MKLLAHSVVPPNPVPYLHLGYIAAIPFANTAPFWIVAVICLYLAGVAGKKRPAIRNTFLVFMCLSVAAVPFAWNKGMKEYHRSLDKARTASSRSSAQQVVIALDMAAEDGIGIPADLTKLGKLYGCETMDGWNRPFRLVKQGSGKQIRYEIHSDGPDKTPNTKDDLSWPYEPPKKPVSGNHQDML
ncbi:MAG: hypothetical protein ACYDCO_19475 [Armatimonadota bacterium]